MNMASSLYVRTPPTAWRYALIGALASLPIIAILNQMPNSEASLGGGIMIFGAFVAGIIAALRSTDPDAAGIRAGFLGGVLGVLTLVVTVLRTAVSGAAGEWSLPRVVFFILASGLVLFVAPIFGLGCGRVGGWVADTVASRWTTGGKE